MEKTKQTKVYLGDSVYMEFNLDQFKLTTENGFGATNTIFFDWDILKNLIEYTEHIRDLIEEHKGEGAEQDI